MKRLMLVLLALLVLSVFAYASEDPDGTLYYDIKLTPDQATGALTNVSGHALMTTDTDYSGDVDLSFTSEGDLLIKDPYPPYDFSEKEKFKVKINNREFLRVKVTEWEDDEEATWEFNLVKSESTVEEILTRKCGEEADTECDFTLPGFGFMHWKQHDIQGGLGDQLTISEIRIEILKKNLPGMVAAAATRTMAYALTPVEAALQPMTMHFAYKDAKTKIINRSTPADATIQLERKPLVVYLENVRVPGDNNVMFGTISTERKYAIEVGKSTASLLAAAKPLPAPHAIDITENNKFYDIDTTDPTVCTMQPTGLVDCIIEVKSQEDKTAFNHPNSDYELFLFSNHAANPGAIEDGEFIKRVIKFNALPVTPIDFTIWQLDRAGGTPSRKCSASDSACTITNSMDFLIRFSSIVANETMLYFDAEKTQGPAAEDPTIQLPAAGTSKDMKNYATKTKPVQGFIPTAGGDREKEIRGVWKKPLVDLSLSSEEPKYFFLDATHLMPLPAGIAGPPAPGVLGLLGDACKIEDVTTGVKSCDVLVSGYNNEKLFENIPELTLVVFADLDGNGKLDDADSSRGRPAEWRKLTIKFTSKATGPCVSVRQCLSEIDKKLVDPDSGVFRAGK